MCSHTSAGALVIAYKSPCSQMSTAAGILQQFNMASRYQRHAGGEKAVLLLDEGPLDIRDLMFVC